MPQLSKKNFEKSKFKKFKKTFKSPLLDDDLDLQSETNSLSTINNGLSLSGSSPIPLTDSKLKDSNISKGTYLSPTLIVENDVDVALSQIENELNASLGTNPGVPLSQDILNREDVKEAFMKHCQVILEADDNLIKGVDTKPKAVKITKKIKTYGKQTSRTYESKIENKSRKNKEKINKENVEKNKRGNRKPLNKKVQNKNERRLFDDEYKKHASVNDIKLKKKNRRLLSESSEVEKPTLSLQERVALIQESRNTGLYVLCDSCDKARYLADVVDPLDLPKKWYCFMNPDEKHNKCSDDEEVEEDDEFLIKNLYNAGSIVWARIVGFPWWPAMVDDDPDLEQYFWLEKNVETPVSIISIL